MIDVEDTGAVRLIAFNRPAVRNAFDFALYRAAATAIDDAAADDAVRAVVLTGRGAAFSAGQDLAEMARIASGDRPEGIGSGFQGLIDSLAAQPKPVVAAVNGAAVGVGLTLLAYCDIVLVDEEARLRAPFAPLGVPPEAGSSYLFPAWLGWQQAARVLLCAEWVDAAEAVAMGIALRTCPPGTVLTEAMAVAGALAAFPPGAVPRIKGLMRAGQADAVAQARRREDAAFAELFNAGAP